VHGKIQTETEKDLGALLQLVSFGDFMDAEFFTAYGAFFASVSKRVQLRTRLAVRTDDVAGTIALGRTHLVLEMRQEG
jgi:hypothetical protein